MSEPLKSVYSLGYTGHWGEALSLVLILTLALPGGGDSVKAACPGG